MNASKLPTSFRYLCHCLKAFKRKEQLSLHSVIHSGQFFLLLISMFDFITFSINSGHKKHSCIECGKGFYRKDHLRKHTRSHIARRLKAGEKSFHRKLLNSKLYRFQTIFKRIFPIISELSQQQVGQQNSSPTHNNQDQQQDVQAQLLQQIQGHATHQQNNC